MTEACVVWLPLGALSPLLAEALLAQQGLVPLVAERLEEALSRPAWWWPVALRQGRARLGADWGPLVPLALPLSWQARTRLRACAQAHEWPLDAAAAAMLLALPARRGEQAA